MKNFVTTIWNTTKNKVEAKTTHISENSEITAAVKSYTIQLLILLKSIGCSIKEIKTKLILKGTNTFKPDHIVVEAEADNLNNQTFHELLLKAQKIAYLFKKRFRRRNFLEHWFKKFSY